MKPIRLIALLVVILLPAAAFSDGENQRATTLTERLQTASLYGPDRLGYIPFALNRLEEKHGQDLSDTRNLTSRRQPFRRGMANDVDAFSLLSGSLAVRETLQLDNDLESDNEQPSIPLASLSGPTAPSHPFEKMLEGRTFSMPALAGSVPFDMYYLHVADPGAVSHVFQNLKDHIGPIIEKNFPSNVDEHIQRRLLDQLGLRLIPENEKYYGLIIEEMAIVGSDLYFKTGTDVTILYRLKRPDAFASTLKSYRDHFQTTRNARVKEVIIDGIRADHLFTEDGSIRSYFFVLSDGTAVLSNSLNASRVIIATARKRRPAMADQDEYRYMRSVYPFEKSTEKVFLYLSDPFIRNLNSPATRIKEARRIMEMRRMARLELYRVFHFQMHGRLSKTLSDLKEEFTEEELALFKDLIVDGETFAVYSRTYGRMGTMRPNIDDVSLTQQYGMPVQGMITEKEADGYRQFIAEYNRYWRTYFDPIGIRVTKDRGLKIETCILPLIDSSIYNSLKDWFGGKSVPMTATIQSLPDEVISAGALLPVSRIEEDNSPFSMALRYHLQSHDLSLQEILKEEVQIHMKDALPLVDFDTRALIASSLSRGGKLEAPLAGVMVWSLFHPIRMTLPVKEKGQEEILQGAIVEAIKQTIDRKSSDRFLQVRTYSQAQDGKRFQVLLFSIEGIVKFRFYIGSANQAVHVTSTQEHLMQIMDGGLERGLIDRLMAFFRVETPTPEANIIGVYRPTRLHKERDLVVSGTLETMQEACFENLSTFMIFEQVFGSKDMDQNSMQSFGITLRCPGGGQYAMDSNGLPYSTVFGSPVNANFAVDGSLASLLNAYLSLKQTGVALEFTEEGLKSTIIVE
ncbi:MAG: hypothetical protein CVV45_11380 [Spirochaetae bacterium HGW-Spirochaetae-10]|nr:MAG: hypothetical protein CVV45_11380 [Spirochaetae bacterium HGW-Spirochaetae-10]